MKNGLLKLIAGTTIAVLGVGVFSGFNQKVTQVDATAHTSNYADYAYEGNYYSSIGSSLTEGLNGTLRKALSTLILPEGWYTYSGADTNCLGSILMDADEDPTNSNNMVYLYTRDSVTKNVSNVSLTTSWNREHVWPQNNSRGHWGKEEAGADLLHIRPTYETTNGQRGNLKYGYESGGTTQTHNGITYGKKGTYFEPIDTVKGDVARIVMYVWTAYYDYYKDTSLAITDTFASYNTLLQWHTLDKPDALEGLRNNYSEKSKQKNRNPFVDHPEYAWQIFGDSASSTVKAECATQYPIEGGQVSTKTLSSIAISGTANKTSYDAGETFNPNGLTVTATYDDNSTAVIPNNNCTWAPNPLAEGTTSITCTYDGKTTTYSGITVQKKQTVSGTYSITFKKNSSNGSDALSTANIMDNEVSENTLIKSITGAYKVYSGEDGLKMGSNSDVGELEMVLVESARENIKSIEIESAKYSKDTGSLILSLDDEEIDDDITPGTTYKKTFSTYASAETITISTSSKRAYLSKITIVIADIAPIEPDPQPSSSSSEPISSYEEIISSSESSSSGEPSSIPSSEEPSSSESESISEHSEEMVPEEDSNVPEESSSVEPSKSSSSSPESQPKKTGGCNGSLLATLSLTSFTALIGLAFVAFKKKF